MDENIELDNETEPFTRPKKLSNKEAEIAF